MSTNLKELAGRKGHGLLVTQFSGGEKDGLCLQFSCTSDSYASLCRDEVEDLHKVLSKWLKERGAWAAGCSCGFNGTPLKADTHSNEHRPQCVWSVK